MTAQTPERPPALVDARCSLCTEAGKGAYRMIGRCRNCGLSPVLGLHSVSHEAILDDCPVCGTRNVSWDRLATPDEIPAEFEEAT